MGDKNSGQRLNLVEKIPALDMALTVPCDGPQSSDQVGANNPCFIMCIDASGRLLRIPMSVLQKQTTNSTSKVNESHDKQKAPVATISPWITPTQNSQGNNTSQLQQPILSLNRSQQMTSQQFFVDQTQQSNSPIHLNQQPPTSQEQVTQKLQLIGSQQQFVDKLQILMQKPPVGNLHLNVKNLPLGSFQFGQQKVSSEQSSNMQQLLLNSNHCASLSQGFAKHQLVQQIQPVHQHPPNNLQVVNRHQENSIPLQKSSCPQALITTSHQPANIPPNLNLLAVLQSNKILQSKGSIQLLDQLSSTHKTVADPHIQPNSSIPVKEEQSLQSNQSWSNHQLRYQDSKNDAPPSSSGANATLSTDKHAVLEGINGKSVLALNSIKFKNIGSKVELSNRPSHSESASNESSHILASQQISVLHQPNKASLLMSNTENASLRANVTALSQFGGNIQTSFHLQSDTLLKDQVYVTQKTDFINNKGLEHIKSEKLQQSQLVFLENKGPSLFQLQSSKYATLSVTPSSNHGSNRSLASTFFTVTPQVQFSTQATPQHIDHASNQILKSGEGLKQVGNVQAIVIPNNISLNALQLPHINGLPLSNLSSIHIISSSGLSHDQVLFLPSHSSTRAQPAMVQTCPANSARQLCGQMIPPGKQLQTPVMVVQSPLIRASVSQEHLRQQKAELNNSHSSCSSKSLSVTGHDSGYSISDVCQNNVNHPQSTAQSSSNNGTQFTVGQEYQLSYPSGLQVVAVWDGKYFKVKNPANANVTPLKTQVPHQDNIESKQHQFSTKHEESTDSSSEKLKDGQQTYPMPSMDDRRFVICKLCGRMGLDHEACENCTQSSTDDVPNKKIRLGSEVNLLTQMNTQQLSINKIMDTKRPKKVTSRKLSSASPKKDAEIVHILSSDDENHSSSWDDSSRIPNSPASANCLPTTSSIPFSGFRVNIRKIFFGKISCDWMNTLTFDGKSVNILSDSCSVSYCLSACGSEVMLVAAYFDANKHCTYLFLQVTHSSAIKLFDRIFVNSRSLYDPMSKDDCAKYIVLFLDDNQTDLMEVIPRVVGSMQLCNGASHPVYKTIENFDVDAFLKSVRLSGDPVLQKESVIINRKCQEEDGDEMHSVDQSLGPNNGKIVNLFTYPPPPATGGITVTNEDLFCLNEGEFLNDVIIDFYFKYLSSELLADKFKNSHVFSSFFYRRLTRKVQKKNDEEGSTNMSLQQRRHAHVKTWTRHVDLFSKDFIVVPINESAHWFLAIICYPGLTSTEYDAKPNDGRPPEVEKVGNVKGKRLRTQLLKNVVTKKLPCILVFDSLSGPSRSGVIKLIRDYLQVEWDLKKRHEFGERHFNKDTLKGAAPECPQQTNFSDCGIYILQYVESFFTDPITDYTFPIKQPLNWFDEKKVCNKRAELQQLILDMQKAHNPGLDFNPDQNGCIIKSCSPELSQMHHSSMT